MQTGDAVLVRGETNRSLPLRGGWRPVFLMAFAALAVVAALQAVWVLQRAMDHPGGGMTGYDFALYDQAARRWLAGGSFYLPYQLAGPYDVPWGQILYPPWALVLFVPFTVLGGPLFVLIPSAITAAVIVSWRPRLWAWAVMLALVTVWPLMLLMWVAGNPTIWVIAVIALATRWPWVSAFVWLKPSVFPFALAGFRDWRWWAISLGTIAVALAMWPMTCDWITAITNARGVNSGLLYSLSPGALAGLFLPVVGWLGRTGGPSAIPNGRRRWRRHQMTKITAEPALRG